MFDELRNFASFDDSLQLLHDERSHPHCHKRSVASHGEAFFMSYILSFLIKLSFL